MSSLQARMLATLGAIVVLSWAASIWIIVALMFHGKDSALEHELTHFGAQLLAALPDPIERQIATVDAAHLRARRNARAHDQAAADAESPRAELERTLTAIVLNTSQLAILGLLMWLAVRTSLRPLRAISHAIAQRKGLDMEPLPFTGCTTERPNGHRAKLAMRNDATPAGMVTMKMQAMMPKMK